MNDIKDIRENPDKYRQMMINRGKDPVEIDDLLRADRGTRIAKTLVQNMHSQENIDTDLFVLYNVPRKKNPLTEAEKEVHAGMLRERLAALKAEELPLRQQLNAWQQEDLTIEIARLDIQIAKKEAFIAECERKEAEILAPLATVLEEIVEEIKAKDFFLQKGRGEGSISRFPRYGR